MRFRLEFSVGHPCEYTSDGGQQEQQLKHCDITKMRIIIQIVKITPHPRKSDSNFFFFEEIAGNNQRLLIKETRCEIGRQEGI